LVCAQRRRLAAIFSGSVDPLASSPYVIGGTAIAPAQANIDPDKPFTEELPPQINLGGLSIQYHAASE
jgi:hypothetical protein